MKIKTYKCNSFNVHTIKTDKFKTTHMEIMFRCPVVKEDLAKQTFLITQQDWPVFRSNPSFL